MDFKKNCLASSWSHSASREINLAVWNCNIISGYLGLQLSKCEKHEEVTQKPLPRLQLTHDSCCTKNPYSPGWVLRWLSTITYFVRQVWVEVWAHAKMERRIPGACWPQAPTSSETLSQKKKDRQWLRVVSDASHWPRAPKLPFPSQEVLGLYYGCLPPCLAVSQWSCGQPYSYAILHLTFYFWW